MIFHKPLRYLTQSTRDKIKNFEITINIDNIQHLVPHKKIVKYLGVKIDYLMRMNEHIITQLKKASDSFKSLCRLFLCKDLDARAKVICYQLLVRPIITYASPIWWNTSAFVMERLRKFERSCLRKALNVYRAENSERMFNNKTIYELAKIPRIDIFLLKLTRNYHKNNFNHPNKIIDSLTALSPVASEARAVTGYLTPEDFMYIDKIGIVQDQNNVPTIYHISRNMANKSLPVTYNDLLQRCNLVYSRALPMRDLMDTARAIGGYSWLSNEDKFIDEIRRRSRRRV